MVAEGAGAEEGSEDPEGIDARFEEIIAGLRAEQAESASRRQEAIRQARSRRRPVRGSSQNRPLQGADDPNPWPPRPREDTAERSPEPGPASHVNPPPNFPGLSGPESSPPDSGPSELGRPESGRPASGHPASGAQESRPDEPVSPASDQPETTPAGPGEAWRGYEEGDDDDHFIPPTPPLPAGDLHLWAIVVGLMGGPVLLILSNVFYLLRDGWWTTLGIALTVGGVVLLVLRLPKTRDYTDSSGGAQV